MKTTIKVTKAGGLTIPAYLRRRNGIEPGDLFEVSVGGDSISLQRVVDKCVCCGETKDLKGVLGKHFCNKCIKKIKGVK